MKTLTVSQLFSIIVSSSFSQSPPPDLPITLANRSLCDVEYTVICTDDDCATTPTTSNSSGTLAASAVAAVGTCPVGYDFAVLEFVFPSGDNIVREITFRDDITGVPQEDCAGIDECDALYPTQWQGIESGCLGANGEIRANYIASLSACAIYFKYSP